MITSKELFLLARDIGEQDKRRHHYIYNAYRRGLKNYRLFSTGEVVKHQLGDKLPKYLIDFINSHGEVLLVANVVRNTVAQMMVRSLEGKEFAVYGKQNSVPYGIGKLAGDFRYGDWIVLVEGVLDRDSLLHIYPNICAVLTAGASLTQREILRYLTNRIILLYDHDKAGQEGTMKDKRQFAKLGMDVVTFPQPEGVKDSGILAELLFQGKLYDYELMEDYYRSWLTSLTAQ